MREKSVLKEQNAKTLDLLPALSRVLIEAIKQRGGRITIADSVSATGENRNTIKAHLRALVAQGRLTLQGAGRGAWYQFPVVVRREKVATSLVNVPTNRIRELTDGEATGLLRKLLRAELRYCGLSPSALTLTSHTTVNDGGIDGEVNTGSQQIPVDSLISEGITGYQIKSGTTFCPWREAAIRNELERSDGKLKSEVERLLKRRGQYCLVVSGHELTVAQRRNSIQHILTTLNRHASVHQSQVNVLDATQLVDFVERYPGIALSFVDHPLEETLSLDDWLRTSHMSNSMVPAKEQQEAIEKIREFARSSKKHLRLIGEPGLGKTRVVLEALRTEEFANLVLYVEHGSSFGSSRLFKYLLKKQINFPLIVVVDDLPEKELADMWNHLREREGGVKFVSLDHGTDHFVDQKIERLQMPPLSSDEIRSILVQAIGEARGVDHWVTLCEGSPRVALAIAENLMRSPDDLLKPPSTMQIWRRFIHGATSLDAVAIKKVDCVTQHIALFSRFGYRAPVEAEAKFIYTMINAANPGIGWGEFQSIVRELQNRRILQGRTTLFFVPKALHVYLWREFWANYGPGFDVEDTLQRMPDSLHSWFMNMFKYADQGDADMVVKTLLRHDGLFANMQAIQSGRGARFISILAEANPKAVITFLERTMGAWSDADIRGFKEHRQHIVWALEKIAVWPTYFQRAATLLTRLAVNENSTNSNNAKGTLIGLFQVGYEAAATETPPQKRIEALRAMLFADSDVVRLLGLECATVAVQMIGSGFRIVGPEYQGMKPRAKLWVPQTWGELWQAKELYFNELVRLKIEWPGHLRANVCEALLGACKGFLQTGIHTARSLQIFAELVEDRATSASSLNDFFSDWRDYRANDENAEITLALNRLARAFNRQSLASRIQRYVADVDWLEWDDDHRKRRGTPRYRAKELVRALAHRLMKKPEKASEYLPAVFASKQSPALWYFGEQLAIHDTDWSLTRSLVQMGISGNNWSCLFGYVANLRSSNEDLYRKIVSNLLDEPESRNLGAAIALRSDFDSHLFQRCLELHEEGLVQTREFSSLQYGAIWKKIPRKQLVELFDQLTHLQEPDAINVAIGLLMQIPFNDEAPFTPEDVLSVIANGLSSGEHESDLHDYHITEVGEKLSEWNPEGNSLLFEILIGLIEGDFRLGARSAPGTLANKILRANPSAHWLQIAARLEGRLPKWSFGLNDWLKGGLGGFRDETADAPISFVPISEIHTWIDREPQTRAALIAHCAPRTLDENDGGNLTRSLLERYSGYDGVKSGISSIFGSGGWVGSESDYLRRRRDKFRSWLANGYSVAVESWIEEEIAYLDSRIERAEISEERERFE